MYNALFESSSNELTPPKPSTISPKRIEKVGMDDPKKKAEKAPKKNSSLSPKLEYLNAR